MTNYNWCHGPSCHEQQTQSRIRGSGTNKVLRTIKIKARLLYEAENGSVKFEKTETSVN